MKNQATLPPNQEQTMKILSDSNAFIEPDIRKAKFIFPTGKTYTLDFDKNIQMMELKTMIQMAAHLRKNSFILVSECVNITKYNEETFDSLFPDKQLVSFEVYNYEENPDEIIELLLQINNPCPDHDYKCLLYYCFDCGKSICSQCCINGIHKGHRIQDKSFYLLPSKYLADKMLENWSQKPYEEFNISVSLNEYKARLDNKIFSELFQLLKEVQNKCNGLIDKYNQINESSLNNIRDSVRDIELYCIRALDEYKNAKDIKDIINSEEMFIEFDNTYKELASQQKEKFRENLQKFQDLNKSISLLVQNLIDKICKNIKDNLLAVLNQKEYENIENKINMKLIKNINNNHTFDKNNNDNMMDLVSEGYDSSVNNNVDNLASNRRSNRLHSFNDKNNSNNNNDLNVNNIDNNKINNIFNNISNIQLLNNNNISQPSDKAFKINMEIKMTDVQNYLKKPFILCPIPGTNKIKIITNDENDESFINIKFPEKLGISCFLKNCAYCNYDKKLYISGGYIENNNNIIPSKKVFVIDLFKFNEDSIISELSPMKYPKYNHSMIGYNGKIYSVGGENSDIVERYDINTNKWEELNHMIKNRSFPNLYIYEGYLYAFFGKEGDEYLNNIERLNLDEMSWTISWELVVFENPNEVDTRIYGCGLYQVDELIYFFGGKKMDQDTDEIFFINMKERLIDRSDAKLKWKESFRENTLFQFGNKLVQISDEKYFGTYLRVLVQ